MAVVLDRQACTTQKTGAYLYRHTPRCMPSNRWNNGHGAWACLAHALQCLCDGCACFLPRALQLVICRFGGVHRRRHPVVSTRCFTGLVRVGVRIPLDIFRCVEETKLQIVLLGYIHCHVYTFFKSKCEFYCSTFYRVLTTYLLLVFLLLHTCTLIKRIRDITRIDQTIQVLHCVIQKFFQF